MELQVSGTLTDAASVQPSFTDCRIEALFDRKPTSASSTPRSTSAELLEDATPIETDLDIAPEMIGAAAGMTLAEAPIPFRVSAVSDAAGNFTLVFPDPKEITSNEIKVVVYSPAGRIIREMEVMAADLCDAITIEVEAFEAGPSENPASQPKTPQRAAVDALFQNEASLRQAIRENLTTLRPESDAVAKRVQEAFAAFNPSNLSKEELARRHYVAPGADPYETLEAVVIKGMDAIRSSHITPTIVLRNDAELKKLIKELPESPESPDSLRGVVELGPLINFISSKSRGSSLVTEPTYTLCKADLQADEILDVVENAPKRGNGDDAANPEDSSSETREANQFVKDSVNLQMKSATAPESQLAYGKIPNSADQDKVQSGILQTFQLRPGASDVTSYHDFHTLQIAFEHVWTEIFDGKLASLGRDLYKKYVELKDFIGSGQPDLQISTLADLRRLMEAVKELSQIVEEDIPDSLRSEKGGQTVKRELKPEDVAKGLAAAATGGLSLFVEWAINELVKLGNNPVKVTWEGFPLKLNENDNNIIEMSSEKEVVHPGNVEIVLKTDGNSFKKSIEFQQWDPDARPIYNKAIQNFDPNNVRRESSFLIASALLNTVQMSSGTLKFISEDKIANHVLLGRYVLGDLTKVLKDRTRVTFYWKGVR